MPFCENCGRQLAENEVCNCTSGATPPPAPAPNPAPTNQPVYNNVTVQPPKKKSNVLLIVLVILIPLVIIGILVLGLLAAIFVPAMIGYTNKSKVSSANASASSICKSANSALVELDEWGYDLRGYYIIASDSDNNYNVPTSNFDVDAFYDKVNDFFSDSDDIEWFVVIENGTATYSATSESWNSDLVGTYPNGATTDGPSYYDTYYLSSTPRTKASITKLYNDAAQKVHEKAEYSYSYDYYE